MDAWPSSAKPSDQKFTLMTWFNIQLPLSSTASVKAPGKVSLIMESPSLNSWEHLTWVTYFLLGSKHQSLLFKLFSCSCNRLSFCRIAVELKPVPADVGWRQGTLWTSRHFIAGLTFNYIKFSQIFWSCSLHLFIVSDWNTVADVSSHEILKCSIMRPSCKVNLLKRQFLQFQSLKTQKK